jgi:hypothetical protein
VLAVLLGAVVSIATQCGPHDPTQTLGDTGVPPGGWGDTDDGPEPGFTLTEDAEIHLVGAGATASVNIRASLSERCLSTSPDYAWGYPTGWAVFTVELDEGPPAAPPDTGAPDTGGHVDTAVSVDTGDTGAPDTGGELDTAVSVDTGDTGAPDTGTSDTGAPDTGASDTGASDTGASDTGASPDSGDTAVYAARVALRVTALDGEVVYDETLGVEAGVRLREAVDVSRPYAACEPDAACEVGWALELRLVDGAELHGDLDAHVRIDMCSVGEPVDSDLTLVLE